MIPASESYTEIIELAREHTIEISSEILKSVKVATFEHFRNGKVHDVNMWFTQDEDGQDCITVCLYVEPNMSRKDYGGKLLDLLSRVNEICEKEYQGTHAFLDFKKYRGQT